MIIVLSDLIVDVNLKFPKFPVQAGDLHRLSYAEIGPGGATNIAIMARRFGMAVKCLGEVGDDRFGHLLLDSLEQEGIDTQNILVSKQVRTPVSVVMLDQQAEPAYLGSPGSIGLSQFPENWRAQIAAAEALFADGWIEYPGAVRLILEAFQQAGEAKVPVFFDPGPMNPSLDGSWVYDAIRLVNVLLVNEEEAKKLGSEKEAEAGARRLLEMGPSLVVLKLGGEGNMLMTAGEEHFTESFPVEVLDKTGAGDSMTGAVIFGYLKGMPLEQLGLLANLVGSAKVGKLGTGHNLPTMAEVRSVAARFGLSLAFLE